MRSERNDGERIVIKKYYGVCPKCGLDIEMDVQRTVCPRCRAIVDLPFNHDEDYLRGQKR